eukprot:CAMPEP_0176353032 /NCGR_PEP_ID=MMETSP0126-20121128/11493_1 /TAXON_ID=141414 ORGANISM="Strombidinopsis acuminatum, Strain SPMC142" /NCGR_SAMPLE_ID=MMETSP0126 /ASSEMBLY_ACC=CAM_ASM_000229 /LENGTH=62 /DNA_ID=CAMNT_0017704485 /DNA_START=1473 /DNA_END=1661 /DNA_ORIENTATION=+
MVQIYKLYTAHEEWLREIGLTKGGEDDDDSSDEGSPRGGSLNIQAKGEQRKVLREQRDYIQQ